MTRLLAAAGLLLGLTASAAFAASTAGPRVVEASDSSYPNRAYVLTLPAKRQLGTSQIHVTENGRLVEGLSVASASGAKQKEFAVVLLVDASNSMKGKPLAGAMAAARAFEARRSPGQSLGVIAFNDKVRVLLPLTGDAGQVAAVLDRNPKLGEGTRIYDALDRARGMLKEAKASSGSIVLLSDGTDLGSVARPAQVYGALADNRVRVFSVGLKSPAYNPTALSRVASATGGSYAEAANPEALKGIFGSLGASLSNQYVIKYRSPTGLGRPVALRVAVDGVPGAATASSSTPSFTVVPAAPYNPKGFNKVIESPLTAALIAVLISVLFGWGVLTIVGHTSESLPDRVGHFVSVSDTTRRGRKKEGSGDLVGAQYLNRGRRPFEDHRYWRQLQSTLAIADIKMTAGQLVMLTLIATGITMLVFDRLIGGVGILVGLAVPFVVRGLVLAKLQRKRRAFAEQLPENLDVLSSSLRAGHTLVGGLTVVIENTPEPSKSELQRALVEERLGIPLEDALKVVVERMDNQDLDQVALVARLQREMGTESAEVLDRVVETVRARMELRRLVQTLTAQGRLSGWVLTSLPIVLALAISLLNPGYLSPLFDNGSGRVLLVMATLMVIAGSVVIRKIVNIKV